VFVCDARIQYDVCLPSERERFDRKFLESCGIAVDAERGTVSVEIVMSGAVVRHARELHAMRNRKPLMGERRATGCGEVDLGAI
jgi:hypothetical protein